MFKKFLVTLAYVTSIPVGSSLISNREEDLLSGLSKYLPYAGIVIAFVLLGTSYLVSYFSEEAFLIATVVTVTWFSITGCLHMDGLMDTADGIFSHQNQKRILEIMQDSRVGNFGVLTGISVYLLKVAALTSLAGNLNLLIPPLVLIPIVARWCELFAIGNYSYAKDSGKGKIWHDTTKTPIDYFVGFLPIILAAIGTSIFFSIELSLISITTTLVCGFITAHRLNKIIGGHTGDTYGSVVELSECGGLLLTVLALKFFV